MTLTTVIITQHHHPTPVLPYSYNISHYNTTPTHIKTPCFYKNNHRNTAIPPHINTTTSLQQYSLYNYTTTPHQYYPPPATKVTVTQHCHPTSIHPSSCNNSHFNTTEPPHQYNSPPATKVIVTQHYHPTSMPFSSRTTTTVILTQHHPTLKTPSS